MTPIEIRLVAVFGIIVVSGLAVALGWALGMGIRAAQLLALRVRTQAVPSLRGALPLDAARPVERPQATSRLRC